MVIIYILSSANVLSHIFSHKYFIHHLYMYVYLQLVTGIRLQPYIRTNVTGFGYSAKKSVTFNRLRITRSIVAYMIRPPQYVNYCCGTIQSCPHWDQTESRGRSSSVPVLPCLIAVYYKNTFFQRDNVQSIKYYFVLYELHFSQICNPLKRDLISTLNRLRHVFILLC